MVDDADGYWRVYESKIVRSRRGRKCYECQRVISVGERYERAGGMLVDSCGPDAWLHFATCEHCIAAREWLQVQCGGWLFGGVYEDLKDHWDEEWLLRSRWLGEAIIGMRRQWRRHGELTPVLGPPPPVLIAA